MTAPIHRPPHIKAVVTIVAVLAMLAGKGAAMAFTLSSAAFLANGEIPKPHTCEGLDQSPALAWREAPPSTKAFVLIVDDPDAPAGTWVHWVLYDMSGSVTQLAAAVPASDTLAGGGKQGLNDFRKVGYGGPCPPAGKPHRYFFKLYALDAPTALPPRASKTDVLRAIEGHVLASAELMGTYKRGG